MTGENTRGMRSSLAEDGGKLMVVRNRLMMQHIEQEGLLPAPPNGTSMDRRAQASGLARIVAEVLGSGRDRIRRGLGSGLG